MSGLPASRLFDDVSQQDLQAFRTSISARRFPALREMRDEDLAALVLANKKVQAKRSRQPDAAADLMAAYRTESDAALATVDDTPPRRFAISQQRAVFSPCNPMQAKQEIALEGASASLLSRMSPAAESAPYI
jgi:hypothetical protein